MNAATMVSGLEGCSALLMCQLFQPSDFFITICICLMIQLILRRTLIHVSLAAVQYMYLVFCVFFLFEANLHNECKKTKLKRNFASFLS